MQEFRKALAELAKDDTGNPQKLVFIVDELDRCRPDYALALLEVIKHFFTVPNVHFVLGVNLMALENCVRVRYGESTDSAQYLQKFLHVKIAFPKTTTPKNEDMTTLRYLTTISSQMNMEKNITYEICVLLGTMSMRHDISLRDIQRIFLYAALLPTDLTNMLYSTRAALIGGIFLKVLKPKMYERLRKLDRYVAQDDVMGGLEVLAWDNESAYPEAVRYNNFWSSLLRLQDSGMERFHIEFGGSNHVPQDPRKWLSDTLTEFLETFTLP